MKKYKTFQPDTPEQIDKQWKDPICMNKAPQGLAASKRYLEHFSFDGVVTLSINIKQNKQTKVLQTRNRTTCFQTTWCEIKDVFVGEAEKDL